MTASAGEGGAVKCDSFLALRVSDRVPEKGAYEMNDDMSSYISQLVFTISHLGSHGEKKGRVRLHTKHVCGLFQEALCNI